MVEKDLSFRRFVELSKKSEFYVHDLLHTPFTYDTWVRHETIIEPLGVEYIRKGGDFDWGPAGPGNFYDFLALRGVALTQDEQSWSIHHKPQNTQLAKE